MRTIQVSSYKSSQLNPSFQQVATIEVEDAPFDSGAFGAVYHCNSVNGKQLAVAQVVKVLIDDGTGSAAAGYKTIQQLQDKIIAYNANCTATGQSTTGQLPALAALPQFSYEGTLDGKQVFGYSANLLPSADYTLFDQIFNHPDLQERKRLRDSFYKTSLEERMRLAYQLAEGFNALKDMSFIYADLNPKNFFVDLNNWQLTIIDYDSGAVTSNPADEPQTYGKPGAWLAPEIQEQLNNNTTGLIKVDLNTDTWAVAVGIHFLFFWFHPLTYLNVCGNADITRYLSKYQWPEIDKSDSNFRTEVSSTYDTYRNMLQSYLPSALVKAFSETINHGFANPNRRLSYRQWMTVLGANMKPPAILSFVSDKAVVINGVGAELSWEVERAQTVSITPGIGDITGKKKISVLPQVNTEYTLTVKGVYGQAEASVNITVFPTPIIESVRVPSPVLEHVVNIDFNMPRISAYQYLNTAPPIDLSIQNLDVSVQNLDLSLHIHQPGFVEPEFQFQKRSVGNKIGAAYHFVKDKMKMS